VTDEGCAAPEAGPTWSERARLDPLAAVIDPADVTGAKNRLIDAAHKHALSRVVGELRGMHVLDFGCGTGRMSAWLAGRGAQVIGVDATPEMLTAARARAPGISFELINGRRLPYDDASFDLVLSVYVLQYYVGEGSDVFAELARVLRSEGALIAIEQVADAALGRGGSFRAYEKAFGAAGLHVVSMLPIRLGRSRITDGVERHAALGRVPGIARLLVWEAARFRKSLDSGRYLDALITARKP
jgi:SAM-dependent methyltransferase